MKLFTKNIERNLIANFEKTKVGGDTTNTKPVVKVFTPDANATWLFSELDSENGLLFGLCDLGMGFPELGYVGLEELINLRGKLGLPVERDTSFEANKTLVEYADEARSLEQINA